MERALRIEGFLSTDRVGWDDGQYFQFIRSTDVNTNGKMIVKAFLDGRITVEAIPRQLTELGRKRNVLWNTVKTLYIIRLVNS